MTDFSQSSLGRLRAIVGRRKLLVPGARIVIENAAGEVLLQLRSDFGLWGLPGGNAEEGEDLHSMIVREVAEETGLAVENVEAYGFSSDPALETFTFPNGDVCQFFGLLFCTRTYAGLLHVADDESLDLRWFPLHQPPEMLHNMYPSLLAYERYRQTGVFQLI
jgi:8-oxo-dGTP pyrophosphatase MutT (NUDIX family)